MRALRRRTLVAFTLALAGAVAFDRVLLTAWGSRAPAWSHWWCSPSSLRSAPHGGAGAGGVTEGVAATLLTPMKALLPHWPHLLPILLALTTLVYLWHANARYHTHDGQAQAGA
jgi:hypothetical protein